jgi:hypothetical protein
MMDGAAVRMPRLRKQAGYIGSSYFLDIVAGNASAKNTVLRGGFRLRHVTLAATVTINGLVWEFIAHGI